MINWRNIRLVKFGDDLYAVRKGWLFHTYYDLEGGGFYKWRGKQNTYFKDCLTTSFSKVQHEYKLIRLKDTVIK